MKINIVCLKRRMTMTEFGQGKKSVWFYVQNVGLW